MQDHLGRIIRYLRLSLTTACQMKCGYCRPVVHADTASCTLLTPEEIEHVVQHFVSRHGVRKVRLTGGDPTTRADLVEIITRLASIPGTPELTMTTNGLRLVRLARVLADAGLHRVNVSLDSLDRKQFERITGIDGLNRVLAGITAAGEAGLSPIKINTVVIRGENEEQLPRLVEYAATVGAQIRFIEMMPMGPLAGQWSERFVSAAEMRHILADVVSYWRPERLNADSAKCFDATLVDGRPVRIGLVTAMSCHFCGLCDRLRLDAAGEIFPCLMDRSRGSLMPAIRPAFDPRRFDELLAQAISRKAAQHPAYGVAVMTHIGG